MNWFRKATNPGLPSVPDDDAERKAAIEKSWHGLQQAQQRVPEVERMTESIRQHASTNNYIVRLQMAYGKRA